MTLTLAWLALAACTVEPSEPALTLDGPAEVRMDHFGPVPTPRVLLGDGTEARPVVWTVENTGVARVEDGGVVAVGAGDTKVVGSLGEDRVTYLLTVEPSVVLRFHDPPANATVGQTTEIPLAGGVPGVAWTTSDPAIATVDAGRVTGVAPGIVYVTAKKGNSEAMLQLEIRPTAP